MEQSDSISKVTRYQLATLASRIDPDRCVKDPSDALTAAAELIRHAGFILWLAVEEEKKVEQFQEESVKCWAETRVAWVKAIKEITGEKRRERAERKFAEFVKHERLGNLSD